MWSSALLCASGLLPASSTSSYLLLQLYRIQSNKFICPPLQIHVCAYPSGPTMPWGRHAVATRARERTTPVPIAGVWKAPTTPWRMELNILIVYMSSLYVWNSLSSLSSLQAFGKRPRRLGVWNSLSSLYICPHCIYGTHCLYGTHCPRCPHCRRMEARMACCSSKWTSTQATRSSRLYTGSMSCCANSGVLLFLLARLHFALL